MAREFRVTSNIRPGAVTVHWTERVPGSTRPSMRLVRRNGGFPTNADDGFAIVDLDELSVPATPLVAWERIERFRCIATNSNADGGLLQGGLEIFYAGGSPKRAAVSVYDPATGVIERTVFDEVSRVTTAPGPATPPFSVVQVREIFATPGGGPEVSRGTVTLFEFVPPTVPPPEPSQFRWAPAAGPVALAEYDMRLVDDTTSLVSGTSTYFDIAGVGAAPSRVFEIAHTANPDAGVTDWTFTVHDRGLEPRSFYYYRLFGAGGVDAGEPSRGHALATGPYGAHDAMYGLLPPVHRVRDIDPMEPAGGRELFRFLAPFGLGVDHFRGYVDDVATRHDLAAARADFLPHLARMIGWIPDLTVPENTQRQDIRFAPELFGGLGTLRNVPALINRVTGWPCRVKEFVHNVFRTNAPEFIKLWEIWQVTRSGGTWSTPAAVSLTTSMDGAPVALEAGGIPWLIWHSDRSGRRELWFQRLGSDTEPQRVMAGAPDDGANLEYNDEAPAAVAEGSDVRLFWTSTRGESRDIWTRLLEAAPDPVRGVADRLTDHPRDDRHPAAVRDGTDLWLFWDSDRRGPRDLWHRRRTGITWSDPQRLEKPAGLDLTHDSFPAAARVGADVWLFWCRDMGDRREIWHQVFSGGVVAGPQQSLSTDLASAGRDEAPWPVVLGGGGQVWLLFHSNRGGPWQIWTRVYDAGAWQAAVRLSAEPTADKEPTGYVDSGGDLHVFFTTQRRTRWYRSRTVDFNDPQMLAELGTFHDHVHYVYDCGKGPDDWYARDTIGLHPDPDTIDSGQIAAETARAGAFLEPFRPAPVRYVWHPEALALTETLAADTMVPEEWVDDVT